MKIRLLLPLFVGSLFPAFGSSLRISPNSATRQAATEVEGNYASTHLYVDEVVGDSIPITIFFDPQTLGVDKCEVFTNLNRRDRAALDANGDGVEDGIRGPDGNTIASGSDAHYYKPYLMTGVSGGYQLTLNATTTGAYRLTVRWRLTSDTAGTWRWYGAESAGGYNKRDFTIVVSPKLARDMSMYELNAMNIESEGTTDTLRSTFVDLWDGPGSTRTPRWNLNYAKGLGANWLWFQPIHPIGIAGRHLSAADINSRDATANATTKVWNGGATYDDVNYGYAFGSPYAVKNFFEVEPRLSKANTRAAALQEFKDFMLAADAAGTDTMNVMLDAPFNHTSWDCELGAKGVTYFSGGAAPGDEFRNREARVFSRSGNYGMRAFSAGSIAPAPDRGDFSKFLDAYDLYFGRYASLVLVNPGDNGNRNNEGDWFDTSIGNESLSGDGNGHFDAITQNLWRYFADYALYWLDQTGCTAGTPAATQVWKGLDGLRADFAQGLPPQAWEYIINKTRSRKWSFVFMAESLDGGAVTYRSSRHFDVLNENILFAMKGLNVGSNSMVTDFRNLFESRRTAYGQAMVLLNTTSHDEDNYGDPWEALIREAVCGSIDGVPMIFSGQELGMSTLYGVDLWERNFGKFIPHFKTYNSMMPLWTNTDYGLDQLSPVWAGIGDARKNSPALRSSNRYFLTLRDTTTHQRIFATAKFENRNARPNFSDTVFALINLDRNNDQSAVGSNGFNLNVDADTDGQNDFGIKTGRTYKLRNIAAYQGVDATRRLTNSTITSGNALLNTNGLTTFMPKVPTSNAAWATAPYEPQYWKLTDHTPPTAPTTAPYLATPYLYWLGSQLTIYWNAVTDNEAGIGGYRAEGQGALSPSPQTVTTSGLSATFTAGPGVVADGATVDFRVRSRSLDDVESTDSPVLTVRRLTTTGDYDADGVSNQDEDTAGTNPLDPASRFTITGTAHESGGVLAFTFPTVSGRLYTLQSSINLTGWINENDPGVVNALGTGAPLTLRDLDPTGERKFYKIIVAKP